MLNDIPIRINRKGVKGCDLAFKIFPLQDKPKMHHRRQKTCDNKENQNAQKLYNNSKHIETSKLQFRYRRASSSGAARKFPKDFFKNQNIVSCIKNKQNKSDGPQQFLWQKKRTIQKQKQQIIETLKQIIPLNTNTNNIATTDTKAIIGQQNIQQGILETPKFNSKDNERNPNRDLKVKLKQYLIYKKEKMTNQLLPNLEQQCWLKPNIQQNLQINFFQTLNPTQHLKKAAKSKKSQEKNVLRQKQNITKKINEKQLMFKKLNLIQPLSKAQFLQNEDKYKLPLNDPAKDVFACFRIRKC